MGYGTSNRTRSDKKEDNLDRHLKIDDSLDSHLKPVKIGEDQTGLQLADKDVKIENDLTIGGDINVIGDIVAGDPSSDSTISGDAITLDATGGIVLDADGGGTEIAHAGTVFGQLNTGTSSTFGIVSSTNYDIHIKSLGTGDFILDSGSGKFIAKKAGTEFSAEDSASAGMILGYTDIGLDEGRAELSLTTSYVVPTDEFSVAFTSPPSGNVEIEIQIMYEYGSSGLGTLEAGLSSANATSGYAQLEDFHEEQILYRGARNGKDFVRHSWTLTGLSGAEEIWVGFKSTTTTGTPKIHWGGNTSGHSPSFIMKAIALPATITT